MRRWIQQTHTIHAISKTGDTRFLERAHLPRPNRLWYMCLLYIYLYCLCIQHPASTQSSVYETILGNNNNSANIHTSYGVRVCLCQTICSARICSKCISLFFNYKFIRWTLIVVQLILQQKVVPHNRFCLPLSLCLPSVCFAYACPTYTELWMYSSKASHLPSLFSLFRWY